MLKPGDSAPNTQILDADGNPVSLADLRGHWVILYFYPKDNTPGCTTQACTFRDYNTQLTQLGAKVIGVSKDPGKSHHKFTDKFSLNFPLWSDPDHQLMSAFGTWQLKKFMGKEYYGTTRSTFIITPQGEIAHVWEQADPQTNAQQAYEFLQTATRT